MAEPYAGGRTLYSACRQARKYGRRTHSARHDAVGDANAHAPAKDAMILRVHVRQARRRSMQGTLLQRPTRPTADEKAATSRGDGRLAETLIL